MKNQVATASLVSVVALMIGVGFASADQDGRLASTEAILAAVPVPQHVSVTDIRPDCVALPILPDKGQQQSGYEVGDKLKLVFYESVVDTEQNKWGKAAAAAKMFQQRPEFSGEYTVQDDKSITVPLLGSISVEGRNSKQLQIALQAAFKEMVGHDGFVTVIAMERPPIYVIGAKNAGQFKYAPGMTVLHAVAMAGGFDNQNDQPWQQIEKVRQLSSRNGSLESLGELLAREAVYKAERDKVKPKPASNLIHIVGSPERANELIGAEMERRLAIVQSRRERDWAMEQRIIAARQQVESLRSRVGTMDPTIKMRKDRVAAYESLMAKGTLARTTVLQAQAELTNDERARGDMLNQLQQAEQALHQLETEKATMEASTRSDLETAIVSVSQQIQSASREADTAGSILVAMKGKVTPISATSGPEPAQAPKYEIVRQTDKGPVVFAAREMSVLRPGDLVRIAESQQPRPMVPSDNAAPSRTNTVPISATDQTGCKQPDR